MTGQSEDNKPSFEVSPGEIRVTKLRNLWQRYKKTLSEGSKISLGDFVKYIKTHDTALFDEIAQTNHDDFLQGWEEKNKHFAHIVWGIIHPQEENGQNRREFLTTLTGATSAIATNVLTGWVGPSGEDLETAEYIVTRVMRFYNSLIIDSKRTNADTTLLLHGPIKSWIRSIDFLGPKKAEIVRKIARSRQIGKVRIMKNTLSRTTQTNEIKRVIEVLNDFRTELQIGEIGSAVQEMQMIKSTLLESLVTLLESLPETIQSELKKSFLINRFSLKLTEMVEDCIFIHAKNLSKKTEEDIKQEKRNLKSYTTHYHGRAILADILRRENAQTIEQHINNRKSVLAHKEEEVMKQMHMECEVVMRKLRSIENQYRPLIIS